jgi:hypothetical protein
MNAKPQPVAVTDVKLSQNAFELIITRQPLSIKDGEIVLGEAVQETIDLEIHRLKIEMGWHFSHGTGPVLLAKVRNYGIICVGITKVALGYTRPSDSGLTEFVFDQYPERYGILPPRQTKSFGLPYETYQHMITAIRDLDPNGYWIAAYSGDEEVARLTGDRVAPFLDMPFPFPPNQ